MTKLSQFFHIAISAGALAWASYAVNEIRFVQIILLSAFFWIVGIFNRWKRSSLLGVVFFTLIAIVEIFRGLPFGWMLAGALFAYLSYDLSQFALRLHFAVRGGEENIALITRIHLKRIALMTLLGLSISTAALIWQNNLDLAWGIFLGIVLIWWVSVMVMWRR